MTIDLERLKKRLRYDPETGQFTWLKGKPNREGRRGRPAGSTDSRGYVKISASSGRFFAHRLAWAFHYGGWPPEDIDHINGDPADNRIQNLRLATDAQNHANQGPARNSKSGVKGVYWDKNARKWKAQIVANGESIHLGYFSDKDDATAARLQADKKYQGAFAWPLSVLG
jgi:hypothetical protein